MNPDIEDGQRRSKWHRWLSIYSAALRDTFKGLLSIFTAARRAAFKGWCSNFSAALLAAFIGVFLAFSLDNYQERKTLQKNIQVKQCFVYLETKHNAMVAIQAQDILTGKSTPWTRPLTDAAKDLLSDPNALTFLSYMDIHVLRRYVYRMDTLGEIIESIHQMRLATGTGEFTVRQDLLVSLRHNIASTAVYTAELQQHFIGAYSTYGLRYENEVKILEQRLKQGGQEVVEGNIVSPR